MKHFFFLFIVILLTGTYAAAQQPGGPPTAGESKPVDIIYADKLRTEKIDSVREIQTGVGKVQARQGTTLFECDSFYYDKSTKAFEAFGNVHINDNDSVNIYSNYLLYHVDTRIANLKKNVRLTDGKSTLTTQTLDYDLNQKIGNYYDGGKVVNEKSVLTSREATYYADRKDVYFKKQVVLIDPQYKLRADSLLYNSQTQLTTFITETYIEDSIRKVTTSSGYYDIKNKKASFGSRPIINDGASQVIADNIDTNDSTGISILTGNVFYKDTAQGYAMRGNYMNVNNKEGLLVATQNAVLIIKQDNDSLFVTGDTLRSGRLSTLVIPAAVPIRDSIMAKDSLKVNEKDAGIRALTGMNASRKDSALAGNEVIITDKNNRRIIPPVDEDSPARPIPAQHAKKAPATKAPPTEATPTKEPPTKAESTESEATKTEMTKTDSAKASPAKDPSPKVSSPKVSSPKDSSAKNSSAKDSSAKAEPAKASAAKGNNSGKKKNDPKTAKQATNKSDTGVIKGMAVVDTKSKNDSADRYFQAYHNVRIFSDSLQAVADSLFYSGKDSIFKLFKDPIMWASNSQVSGDTIYIFTKNKKAERVYVFENSISVNKTGTDMYNQLKGTRMNGFFKEGVIDYLRAKGNAESIYYARDKEDYLVGINRVSGDIIDLRFLDKELNRVVVMNEVKGTMYPVTQMPDSEKKLRNFKWLEDRRPKTKFELFQPPKPIPQPVKPAPIADDSSSSH